MKNRRMRVRFIAALALSSTAVPVLAAPALAQDAAPTATSTSAAVQQIDAVLNRKYPALEAIYKDLHAHPEIAFQETRSAAILAKHMRKLGLEVTEGIGKTGLVAIMRNGNGPTVLIRADMDGLPMEEKTGLPYASKHTQIVDGQAQLTAHGCGHDIHMTWWLATAEALIAAKSSWAGTVMFVAQPAEERVSGAKAMVRDGLFERFPKPDYGFAAHITPAPEGLVAVKPGATTSSSDTVAITFNGRGAHGSSPQQSIDPIVMGSQFVNNVQTLVSRQLAPDDFAVVTVGSFQSGTVANIIPDKATLKLTLRSQKDTVRQKLLSGVQRTAKAVADSAGAPAPTVEHTPGGSIVINDASVLQKVSPALTSTIGSKLHILPATAPAFSGSEDFSEFVNAGVPSVYYWIGGYDPKDLEGLVKQGKEIPSNHSPFFAPRPEIAIKTGAKVLALSVISVAPAAQ